MLDFSGYGDLLTGADVSSSLSDDDLAVASALVRAECGWHIAPSKTETLVVDVEPRARLIGLPSLHVTAVSAVTDSGDVPIAGWEWSSNGVLERTGGVFWPAGRRRVKVTLTHGFAVAPADVVSVVTALARDAATVATSPGLVKSMGPFTFQDSGDRLAPLSRYRLVC